MNGQNNNRYKGLQKAVSVALMGTICLTAAFSVTALSKTVTVTDGEKTMTINTMNSDTDAILVRAGVELGSNDKLVRTDAEANNVNISIMRAFSMDGKESRFITFDEGTVADALKAAGMTLSQNDSASLSEKASGGSESSEITIKRFYTVKVNLRGKIYSKEVPEGTVQQALNYLEIELNKNDKLLTNANQKVENGLEIKIENTTYKKNTKIEKIGYKTETQSSDELYDGERKVIRSGVEGERKIVTNDKIVNGKVVESKKLSSEVVKEPINEVVLVGTKERVNRFSTSSGAITVNETEKTLTDPNGNTVDYTQVLTGSGTAYYSEEEHPLTATGRAARYGVVAVDPDIIPYGSILYIVSNDGQVVYGYAVAGDTGGALWEGTAIVDLYYDTLDECCVFGRRDVTIYVLSGVPESATYN